MQFLRTKVDRRLEGNIASNFRVIVACFLLVSCFTYCLTLNVESMRSSETSAELRRTTWYCIPEDKTLHIHRYENF
jgi:hypothetical protein